MRHTKPLALLFCAALQTALIAQTTSPTTEPAQLADLRRTLATETNAAAKGRLQQQINALEDDLTLHPPPISLHLKNAPLPDVWLALTPSFHANRRAAPQAPDPARPTYTLDLDNTPYWKVIQALGALQPDLTLHWSDSWTLEDRPNHREPTWELRQTPARGPFQSIQDPFVIHAKFVRLSQPSAPDIDTLRKSPPIAPTLHCAALVDPRVSISRQSRLDITQVTDQAGANVLPPVMTPQPQPFQGGNS